MAIMLHHTGPKFDVQFSHVCTYLDLVLFDLVLCTHVIIPCSTDLIVPRDKSHRKGKRYAKPASCGCGNSSDLVYSNKQRLAKRCLLSCSIVWARVVIVIVERIRMSSDINLSGRSTNSLVRVMRVAWGTTPGILLPRRAACTI